MKGVWWLIAALIFVAGLVSAAFGADWVLAFLQIISHWLTAWPPPDEHFASMIGALGWPLAVLLIVWLLRRPLRRAAYLLAERMKTDALKFGGFLEITAATSFESLDRQVAVEHAPFEPEADDVEVIESLLEYAGISDQNAERLLHWIAEHLGPALDPEAFMTDDGFANERRQAYIALVEG